MQYFPQEMKPVLYSSLALRHSLSLQIEIGNKYPWANQQNTKQPSRLTSLEYLCSACRGLLFANNGAAKVGESNIAIFFFSPNKKRSNDFTQNFPHRAAREDRFISIKIGICVAPPSISGRQINRRARLKSIILS
jgi:hypothetical protein